MLLLVAIYWQFGGLLIAPKYITEQIHLSLPVLYTVLICFMTKLGGITNLTKAQYLQCLLNCEKRHW